MSRRLLPAAFAAGLAFLMAFTPGASGEIVRVELAAAEIPHDSLKTFLGASLRPAAGESAPEGFDAIFRFDPPDGGRAGSAVLLRKTEGIKVSLHLKTDTGPVALSELGPGIFRNTVAFGPVKAGDGSPLFFALAFKPESAGRAAPAYLYLLPAQMLAGEASIGGRRIKLGLIDANLDGSFGKACVQHMREGDWFAADADGDGRMLIDASGNEGRPLTQALTIGGRTWSWKLDGLTLTLEPARLRLFQIRLEGLPGKAMARGWSAETGAFAVETREDGSFEMPLARTTLQGYSVEKDGYTLNASVKRTLGTRGDRHVEDDPVAVGPPVSAHLSVVWKNQREGMFSAKLAGKAGETLTLSKQGKRTAPPELVILGPDGSEAHRAAMSFG